MNTPEFPFLDISACAYLPEAEAVSRAAGRLEPYAPLEGRIRARAGRYVEVLRAERGLVADFLSEYGLNDAEGLLLMRLAEALLRIPDAATQDALIEDIVSHGRWRAHRGRSESLPVNLASLGLMAAGYAVGEETRWQRLLGRIGEPVLRGALKGAMGRLGREFVLGRDMEEALRQARGFEAKGYRFSFDMLGEGARTQGQADAYLAAYAQAIHALSGKEGAAISVKLSALHPRYHPQQHARVMSELRPALLKLLLQAREAGVDVAIDAEEAARLEIEARLFASLYADPALAGWEGLGFVLQAYQKRALPLSESLRELARTHGRRLKLRLVKGAYWDTEIKLAQVQGLAQYPVFTRKDHTDMNYLACARVLLEVGDAFYPQFATHNARTAASVIELAESLRIQKSAFEFQRLHGMGAALHDALLEEGFSSRIYAPVGRHAELLPYLIRRLLENGANNSFVHQAADARLSMEALLRAPETAASALKPPPNLYGSARANSLGVDFGNEAQSSEFMAAVQRFAAHRWEADGAGGPWREVENPSGLAAPGRVREAREADIEAALAQAQEAAGRWAGVPVETRARALERLAELLERNRAELCALLAREAGKTLPDALGEVREAVDFCRYYAAESVRLMAQAQNMPGPAGEANALSLHPRGVFACISPWNFPLSIFTGQIAAALAAGNAVLAKPAQQTPLIAARAVALMMEAGIPPDAVRLLPGGREVGARLVEDARVDGVAFTGSTLAANRIAQALAARGGPIAPLIAETGGQNCMVVDSSALLEQAADDILASAFGSAGQRCSALRMLYVQEEVADALIALLAGAMAELTLGDPLKLSTDIGPIIDAEARANLSTHLSRMEKEAKPLARAPLPEGLTGHFLAPQLIEIRDIAQLPGEVFGPVLHVIRFPVDRLEEVCAAINSTGYGLTFGIHSRIQAHIGLCAARIRAGNLYVNRPMTGAVVGVQPFGGEGLSGTGFKAGGPHYLLRFMVERALSVNTAAIGGNAQLLGGYGDY